MVSEWMDNGDIMKYVRANTGNHLRLVGHDRVIPRHHLPNTLQLADAVEGLGYLHHTSIVHGDLKAVSLPFRIPRAPLM